MIICKAGQFDNPLVQRRPIDIERIDALEKKFWAMMRVLARKSYITKDEFLTERVLPNMTLHLIGGGYDVKVKEAKQLASASAAAGRDSG